MHVRILATDQHPLFRWWRSGLFFLLLLCFTSIINPRRACAARVTVLVLSVCLGVRASSSTTGYEAANQWHQRVVSDEKIDIDVAIFPKRLRSRDMA